MGSPQSLAHRIAVSGICTGLEISKLFLKHDVARNHRWATINSSDRQFPFSVNQEVWSVNKKAAKNIFLYGFLVFSAYENNAMSIALLYLFFYFWKLHDLNNVLVTDIAFSNSFN
jgi:hypothetical protein